MSSPNGRLTLNMNRLLNIDNRLLLAAALALIGIVALRKMVNFDDVNQFLWAAGTLGIFCSGFLIGRVSVQPEREQNEPT